MEDLRQIELAQWVMKHFSLSQCQLCPLTGDAGFRRYFRFIMNGKTYIAVDAPVDKCKNAAFLFMQERLKEVNIHVPSIIAFDEHLGFFCLEDLGDILLSTTLNKITLVQCYQSAIALLPKIISIPRQNIPVYDKAFIQLELEIFDEWLLTEHLSIVISNSEKQKLQQCFDCLIENAVNQPQVVMHRDFHSRNLMVVNSDLAVIDFQDAVIGPITYDIVSLLRDCYVKWPRENILPLFKYFIELMGQKNSLEEVSWEQWLKWFDLMGLQRHIKASGIFTRLYHRDGKSGYLADIPLTLSYIVDVSKSYPELTFLHDLVANIVIPKLALKNKEEQT